MNRLIQKLGYAIDLTPRETWRLVRGRLPLLRGGPTWTVTDLMASPKYRNGIRFAELLLRQEAVVARHMKWEPLDFDGKRVVEVGCGPLGGYGPLAIFRGAVAFESADPEWDPELFSSERITEQYLYVMHADLTALFGPRMSFDVFREALKDRMTIHNAGFEKAPFAGTADIVLSQSCLEHVFPLEATIGKLAELQHAETRFLHLVDFGNHYLTTNPFEGLYEQPAEEYIARRGKAINMLRVCDVAALFEGRGIAAKTIPSRIVEDTYTGTIHPWWRQRYSSDAALYTQLAIVAGPSG